MKKEKLKLDISLEAYPLEAIYSAAYTFIDKVYAYLFPGKNKYVILELTAKEGTSKKQLEKIKGEFQNELLNASLRLALEKSNKKIRQSIVERALFSSIGEEDIWSEEDPMEIAVPWEDKNK
jgi:His-Xaa-Ser system protein HxsD